MNLLIGQGLLGSGFAATMEIARPDRPISWSVREAASAQLRLAARQIQLDEPTPWTVLWCAGASTMRSTDAQMADEAIFLETFLDELRQLLDDHGGAEVGVVFVASSAGGIYGNGAAGTITEDTPLAATTSYARGKLAQEELLQRFHSQTGVRCVVGRISNLYGTSQNLAKSQGLVSHVCRATLHRSALTVTVPLDTRRDYIHTEDAARRVAATIELARRLPPAFRTKLIVSGRSATVAEIISGVRRVARLRPLVVFAQGAPLDSPRYQSFRSIEFPAIDDSTPCRSLDSGIHGIWMATWRRFVAAGGAVIG